MIESKKMLRVIVNILLGAITLVSYLFINDSSESFIALSIISLITFIIVIRTNSSGFSSPFMLFMIIMFVYNCGQIWLNLFGVPIKSGNYTITRYSFDLLSQSLLFFILIIVSINLTFICKMPKEIENNNDTTVNETSNDNIIYTIFWLLLLICILYDIIQARIAYLFGYATALYSRSDNELLYMCNCSLPIIVFWGIRTNILRKKKIVMIVVSIFRYAMTTILIGYRMQAISFMLTLLVLLPGIVKEDERKKYNVLLILGVILAAILSIYAANRRRSEITVDVWDSYNSLIQELGGTFTDLPIIIRDIDDIGPVYGLSYLCGVLYIIPFIGRLIPSLSKYVNLSAILYTRITIYGNSSLGGSILAEFFYNFKWASVIIAGPFVGWLLAKICSTLKQSISPFKGAMCAYIFYILILLVRGNMGEITIYIRCAVYITIIYYALLGKKRLGLGAGNE